MKTAPSLLRVLLAAGAFLLVLPRPALALELENLVVHAAYPGGDRPEIHVAFDREADTWNQVTNHQVEIHVDYEITVKSAYALAPGSRVAVHVDNLSGESPLVSANSNYSELHMGRITLRRAGNALDEIKSAALATCQLIRTNRGKPSKEHRTQKIFLMSASARAQNTGPFFTDESLTHPKPRPGVSVTIVCLSDPGWHEPFQPESPALGVDQGTFKPSKIEVFLTTFQNQVTHPTPGASCKKLQVKVRIEANREGVANYKLWRTPGEERTGMPMTKFQKSGPLKGRFIAEDVYVDTFDSTTHVQYMAEMGGTFGVSTPWKDIHIVCSSAGGLSVAPPGGGPDRAPPRRLKAPSTIPPPPPAPPVKRTKPSAPTG
jgi:hypothetical protein